MSILFRMSVTGQRLLVTASGEDDSPAQVLEYGLAVIEAAIQHQVRQVLCDERNLTYRIGTVDTYLVAEKIAEAAPKVGRVALVCNAAGKTDAKFWENVAVNRGLIVRVFQSMDEAVGWLDQLRV